MLYLKNYSPNNFYKFNYNKNLFFYFYYWYNYFYFKELNLFNLIQLSFYNSKFFFNLFIYIVSNNYANLSIDLNNLNIKDNLLLIIYELKINQYNFISNKFYLYNFKIKIYFYFNFILRIEFLYFIRLPEYLEYFKIYKYNEYLNSHNILYKFKLIHNLLRINYNYNKLNMRNKNKFLFSNISILSNFIIYAFKLKFIRFNNYNNKNLVKIIMNKNKIVKNFLLFNNYKFFIIKYYNNLIYLLFYYNIINNYNNNIYLSDKPKFKFKDLNQLYFNIEKYNINLYNLFKFKLFINLNKKLINNLNSSLFVYNLFVNYNNFDLKINNIWFNIVELVIINYIDKLFFKFYSEINFLKLNKKLKKKIWIYSWFIIKNGYVLNWINFILENKINSIINTNKFIIDFIIWKIYFINKINLNYKNLNLSLIITKINIDKKLVFNYNNLNRKIIIILNYLTNNLNLILYLNNYTKRNYICFTLYLLRNKKIINLNYKQQLILQYKHKININYLINYKSIIDINFKAVRTNYNNFNILIIIYIFL